MRYVTLPPQHWPTQHSRQMYASLPGQVRCLVGGMSGVTFRGLGSCRVHIFLRVADTPVQGSYAVPANMPAAAANLADAVGVEASDIEEVRCCVEVQFWQTSC